MNRIELLRAPAGFATRATIAGQVVGVLGLVIQWIAEPSLFSAGFPPGLIYVLSAASIVWLDRRAPWAPIGAVALSLWIVVGGIAGGNLTDNLRSPNLGVAAGTVVMVLGLLLSVVSGIVAIVRNRRAMTEKPAKPLSALNPRRAAYAVAVLGLLMDAVGDAAPEGLNWDGPGPVLFLALALLVAFVPGQFMVMLAMVLSAAFVVGSFSSPEAAARFTDSSPLVSVAAYVQTAGLVVALFAGLAAILPVWKTRDESRVAG
jgi:hypothetical protein